MELVMMQGCVFNQLPANLRPKPVHQSQLIIKSITTQPWSTKKPKPGSLQPFCTPNQLNLRLKAGRK
ncbi:hypothetical protein ANCCAN_19467 [Ancylostoma caninum]|uniref:Uncharacterized protein n=1 Tax=Ancylostoma caninum TaxID=29170 RepID=A0A368FR41_ANCCA|nr:hypothetical protein ANCCAN_19467 [Ancylostoma caninum]